jgi:CheY-like chemotaxis protein
MPDLDGIKLANTIKKRPHLRQTQLVMLTSVGQSAVGESLDGSGISACLVKPVRREHLGRIVTKLCGRPVHEAPHDTETGGQVSPATRESPMGIPVEPSSLSILVAEDNPVNQRVLIRMLERLGHAYELVEDGAEAIAAARRRRYDVVLMDCQMPRIDGFEAAAEIRKLPGAAGLVPIIAVTANAMNGDRERCLSAGMTGYLAKPIRLRELADALGGLRPPSSSRPAETVDTAP